MGNVLNRTTGIYLESVNTPDYPSEDWVINPDLSTVSAVAKKHWFIDTGDVLREMTTAEKATSYLSPNKLARCNAVDGKTQQLVATGFVHSTKTFSLSIPSQLNWTNVKAGAAADLTYPYVIPTLTDTDYHEFADEAEMLTAAGVAESTVKGHIASGAALKKQIVDAADQAELDAVVDTR